MRNSIPAAGHCFVHSPRRVYAIAIALGVLGLADSVAAWPTLVCNPGSATGQSGPTISSNGIGGAYVAFTGLVVPNDPSSAYGTHLTHSGALFPPTSCGDTLFLTAGHSSMSTVKPRSEPDGVGGVFVAVQQTRDGSSFDIFMQRVNGAGGRLWGAGGVGVCTEASDQTFGFTPSPVIATDGDSGCYVIWEDRRFAATHEVEIFLQHLLANGSIHGGWPAGGLRLTTQAGLQLQPTVVSDDSGGVFAVWEDQNSGAGDIKALRVLPDGNLAGGWAANGNAVCSSSSTQLDPVAAPDGSGGVYVAWADGQSNDIYASRLLRNGSLAPGDWVANGLGVAVVTGDQAKPAICVGPNQNAIIAWMDLRQPSNAQDIFAQSIGLDGTIDWTTNGVPVSSAAADQAFPRLVSTEGSGAVITWDDKRGGTGDDDVFAQALDSQGQVQWQANGVPIGFGPGNQKSPVIASDGDGGAIIAYSSDGTDAGDILAARVFASGAVGGVTGVTNQGPQARRLLCSPNPATSSVSFHVADAVPNDRLVVRDLLGRSVATISVSSASGIQRLNWNLMDRGGKRVAPGMYFVQLVGGTKSKAEVLVVEQ